MTDKTLELAMELISRPSVTPLDEGCQEIMIRRLESIGFTVQRLKFAEVDNFWAEHGEGSPLIVFAGHTDVVPSGPQEHWNTEPFRPEIRDGCLFGRGAVDMKSSLAAFVTAIEDFLGRHPRHAGTIALLITSDEEGPSVNGTVKVVEWLKDRNTRLDYCIIGEPTASERLGDIIKNGRRGTLSGFLTVRGIQGHVAYPHLARNPIHMLAPVLTALIAEEWDQGNEYFPKTTFQVSNLFAGTGADNVIPGIAEVRFNFRYSTAVTEQELRRRVEALLDRHGLDYSLVWNHSGKPFLTPAGRLVETVRSAIRDELSMDTVLSTSGGTSDGRFIATTGAEVVELGPCHATAHKVNECIPQDDPGRLARVYARILEKLLVSSQDKK